MISYVYLCYLLIPSPLVESAKELIQVLEIVIALSPAQLYCTTDPELDIVFLFILGELQKMLNLGTRYTKTCYSEI
jgi:hypothetical protein